MTPVHRFAESKDPRRPAVFQAVKLKDDGSEKEEFFCEEHGQEYAIR